MIFLKQGLSVELEMQVRDVDNSYLQSSLTLPMHYNYPPWIFIYSFAPISVLKTSYVTTQLHSSFCLN